MQAVQTRASILNAADAERKIKRMALEVAEQNEGEKAVVIAGVVGNGETVAACLAAELSAFTGMRVELTTVQLNKREPMEVSLQPAIDLHDKVVVIADDVANTGRTLFYALKPFLAAAPRKVQTLALVERSHKLFPIHTDYTGLSIATTLQEHITVEAVEGTIRGAWLH